MVHTTLTENAYEEVNYIYVIFSPSIIKEIPLSNEKRLSTLSSSKNIFQK